MLVTQELNHLRHGAHGGGGGGERAAIEAGCRVRGFRGVQGLRSRDFWCSGTSCFASGWAGGGVSGRSAFGPAMAR